MAKTESRACGRKGHCADDRECAISSSSSSAQNQTRTARTATRQQLTNQANQAGVCFVLNEYSDDPDTPAYTVGQNVHLPSEGTEQIPLTPTASAAVETKNNDRAMDDNDEIWATEGDHRTGWNKTFKSGTYRGMLYGIVLRDYPKQVVTLTKAKSVSTNMREFLSWAQRHYRIDVTASTNARQVDQHLLVRVQVDVNRSLTKVRTRIPSGYSARSAVPFAKKNVIRSGKTQLHVPINTRTTGGATHTRERRIVLLVELTLILFRVRSSTPSRQHVQLLRIVTKR